MTKIYVFAISALATNSIGYGPPLAWCFIHFDGFGYATGSVSRDYPLFCIFFKFFYIFYVYKKNNYTTFFYLTRKRYSSGNFIPSYLFHVSLSLLHSILSNSHNLQVVSNSDKNYSSEKTWSGRY